MNLHEQFAEDLALYALNALGTDERSALEKHLQECAGCRRELEQLRGDMALMALSASGPVPPQRSRQRLLDGLAREPRRQPAAERRSWWSWIPLAAAAAFAIAFVVVWRQNAGLKRDLARLHIEFTQQQAQLERARQVFATLTATDAMRVTLVAAKTPPQPQGKAIYLRDHSSLIFLASNLPAVPANKAYELWLIPTSGAPVPAGVFKPDSRGSATVVQPPLPAGVEAKAFAITIEPEQGSAAPTSPILMLGAGE
jgi:anti-sigma-K factor RskA